MVKRIIALITDFGTRDPYVGVMKGVIKTVNPEAEIIDLTHSVHRHDVHEAAIMLMVSYKYFPKNTIFTCVVDPGVGSGRRAILIESSNYWFVGPDNGCLYPAADRDKIVRVYDISSSHFRLKYLSYTFHGRDLFAPVSAYLSLGIPPDTLGKKVDPGGIQRIAFEPPILDKDAIKGKVIYIDVFGNIMTNIEVELLWKAGFSIGEILEITLGDRKLKVPFVESFSHVPQGRAAVYINSWGYLEIGIYMGDASRRFSTGIGENITVRHGE